MNQPMSPDGIAVELRQDQRIGEEHRIVAERLRRHQRDAEHGAAAVVA